MTLQPCTARFFVLIFVVLMMTVSWGQAAGADTNSAQVQVETEEKKLNSIELEIEKMKTLRKLMAKHGVEILISIIILILGILMVKKVTRTLKSFLKKFLEKEATISIIANGVGIVLLSIVIFAAALEVGAKPRIFITLLTVMNLAGLGILIIFRPLLPKLPFKKGHVIEAGTMFGTVEATSFLNTQIRTFEGKTFFVPNRTILNDVIINYHFTPTRRVRLNVLIGYDQDLARAKQVLEGIMINDARVKPKPAPVVYVLELGDNGVKIGGRCWVDNKKYWTTKCELTEIIKYEFDHEEIGFAYPQLDIHYPDSKKSACCCNCPKTESEDRGGRQ